MAAVTRSLEKLSMIGLIELIILCVIAGLLFGPTTVLWLVLWFLVANRPQK